MVPPPPSPLFLLNIDLLPPLQLYGLVLLLLVVAELCLYRSCLYNYRLGIPTNHLSPDHLQLLLVELYGDLLYLPTRPHYLLHYLYSTQWRGYRCHLLGLQLDHLGLGRGLAAVHSDSLYSS